MTSTKSVAGGRPEAPPVIAATTRPRKEPAMANARVTITVTTDQHPQHTSTAEGASNGAVAELVRGLLFAAAADTREWTFDVERSGPPPTVARDEPRLDLDEVFAP